MSNETDSISPVAAPQSGPKVRAVRKDGWTEERRALFLKMLARFGSMSHAARAVGMSRMAVHRLRQRDPDFDDECAAQIRVSVDMLRDVSMARAATVFDRPIFDGNGNLVRYERDYNDDMLRFILSRYDFNAERDFGGGPEAAAKRREARRRKRAGTPPRSAQTDHSRPHTSQPHRSRPNASPSSAQPVRTARAPSRAHARMQSARAALLAARAEVTMDWLDEVMFTEEGDAMFVPQPPPDKGYRPL